MPGVYRPPAPVPLTLQAAAAGAGWHRRAPDFSTDGVDTVVLHVDGTLLRAV